MLGCLIFSLSYFLIGISDPPPWIPLLRSKVHLFECLSDVLLMVKSQFLFIRELQAAYALERYFSLVIYSQHTVLIFLLSFGFNFSFQ